MKKKALIIAYNGLSKVGGVQNVIYQTILSLYTDFDFDIVVFNDDDYYLSKLKNQGVDCVNRIKISFPKIHKYLGSSFRQCFAYRFAKKLFTKKKYDVVHSFKELDSWPFLKAASKANVPVRIFHNNVIHSFKGKNILSNIRRFRLRKKSLKYATVLVAASKHCGDILYDKKPYNIIYNTYDSSKFYIDTKKSSELSIVQVGIFCNNKNQLFSIEVFNRIRKITNDCSLILVGYEAECGYLNEMISAIQNNGLTDYVKIIDGRKVDIENYTKHASCLLIPSYNEGASIVAVEGQACGIPVFSSTNISDELNCGGLNRIEINEKESPEIWARSILTEYKKNGNERKSYDLKKFSFDSFKAQISQLYK